MPDSGDPHAPSGSDGSADDLVAALLADGRFVAALKRLQRKLDRLAARLDRMRDMVDEAGGGLEDLVRRLPGARNAVPRCRVRRLPAREDQGLMRLEAEAGVSALELREHPDGSCDVRVNGRPPFRVPPQPAILLSILVGIREPDLDGLVRWHTKAEVAAALSKRTGHAVTPADVARIVHKLRKAFRDAGENEWLLHVRRARGIRFALRPVIDGDAR